MDDIDLYEDLDEFQEQHEQKSKELKEAEAKYQEALQTIHQLEEENKSLTKKLHRIELSFQSLLDTARTEIRRKDAEIERLRKEKDDICFRRRVPTHSKNVEQNQRSSASERRDEQRLPKCDAEKHPARNETSEDIQGNPIKRRLDSSPTIPSDKRRNTNDEYHRNTGKISAQDASYSSRCKDKKAEVSPVRQSYKEKYWERRDERDRRSHHSPSTKRRNECRKRSPDHRDHQRSHHRDRESKNKSDYERENEYKRSHSHRSDSRKTENHVTADGDSNRSTEHLHSSKVKEMKNLGSRTPPTLESNNRIPSDNQSSINESDNKPKKDFRKEEEKSKCFVAKNNEINPEEGPPKDNVAGSSNRCRNDQQSCKNTVHTSSKENLCDAIFQRLDADSKRMDTLKLHHDKLDLYEVLYEDLTKDSEESKMPTNHQTATNLYDTLYEDLTEDPKEISNKTSNDQTGTDVCDMLYDDLDTKPREEANENMKTQTKDNVCDVLYDYLDEESKGKREQPKSSTDQISGKENGKPSSNEDVCVILHPALIQESQKNVNITRPSNTPRKDVLFNALFGPSPSTTESSSGGTPKNIINRNLEMGSKTTSPSEYSDIDSGPNSKNNQPTSFNKMELEKCFVPNDAKLTKNVIDLTEQEEEEGDICDNEKGVDFKGYTADKQTGNSNENRNAQNNTNIQIPGLDLLMVSLTKDILKTSKRIDEITAATKTQEVSMTRDSSLVYKAKDLQNTQCINEKVCPTTDTNQMSSLTENQNGKAVTRESSCRMTAGSNSGNSIESKQSEIYTINKEVEGPMKPSEITNLNDNVDEPLNCPKIAKPSETSVLFTNPNESSLKEDDIPNAVVDVAESSTKSAGHNNADSSPKMEFSSKETGKIHLQKSQLHVEHISDPVNTAEEVFHVNESEMKKSSKNVSKDVNLKEASITANLLPSKSAAAVQNVEDTSVTKSELKFPPKSLEAVLRTDSVTSSKASDELDLPPKSSSSELGEKSDLFSLSETKAKSDPPKLETPTKTPTSKTLNISALSPEALSTCEKSDFTNLDSPLKLSKELENMCFKPITCIKSAKVSPKLDCRTTAALNTSKKPAVDSNYSNSEEPKSIQAQRDSPQLNCTSITPIKLSKACESSPRVMQTLLYCDESLPADSTSNTPLIAAKELDTSSTSSKQNSSGCSSLDLTWSDGTPEKNKTIETESCSSKEFKQEGDPTNLIPQKAEVIKEKSVPKLQEDRKPIETTLENQEISNSKGDSNLGSSPELKTATKESEDLETSLIIIDDHQDDQDVLNSKSHLKPESPTKLHKDTVEPEDSDASLIIVDDQELCDSKRDLNQGSPNKSINEKREPEEDSVVHNFFAVATNNSEIFELEEENMGEELEVSNPVISEGGVDEDRDLEPRVDNNLKLDRNVSTQNSNTFENNPKEANNNCLETYSKIPAMCQQSAMCPGQEKDELGQKKEMPESECGQEENLATKTSSESVGEASAVRDKTTKENNGRASEQTKAPLVEDEQPSLISEDQKRHSILTKDIGNSSTEKFKTNISLKNLNTVEHFEESEKDKELKMHEAKVLASSEEKHKDSMVEQSEKCIENPSEEEDKDSMGGQSEKAVEKATEEKENLVMESPMKNKTPLKFSKETNLDYMEMANVASAPLEIAENSAKGNNGLEAKSKDEIENLANFSNEAKEVNVGSSDQGKFSLQPQLNLRFTKETNLADHDKTENHQENSDLTSKLANGTTETTGKEFENTSSLLSKDTSVGHASMPSLTKQKTDFKVPIPQNVESNLNNKTPSAKSELEIVKFQSPSKTKLSPIINNTSSDCTTTLKSLSLNDCYNVPIVLPSISTSCPTPSNFSGIFSKNIHKSSSENLLENSNISTAKSKEFILPATSVLCTVDTLKDATKTTTTTATTTMNLLNKKLHWELLEVNKDTIEIEDDSDADSSDEDKKLKIMEEEDQKDEIQNMTKENAAEEEKSPKGGLTCLKNDSIPPALETLEVKELLTKDSKLKFSDKIKGSRTQERQKTKPLTVSPIRVRSAEKLMDKAILRLAMIKKKKLPLCLSYKSKCHRIAKKKPKLIAGNSKQRKGKAKNGKSKMADTDDSRSTLGEILSSSMQEKLVLETVPKRDNLRRGRCLDENMRSVKGLETASFNEKVPFDLRGKGEGHIAAEKTIKAIDVSECHAASLNKNALSVLRDNGEGAIDDLKKAIDDREYHSPPSNKKAFSELLRGNEEAIITADEPPRPFGDVPECHAPSPKKRDSSDLRGNREGNTASAQQYQNSFRNNRNSTELRGNGESYIDTRECRTSCLSNKDSTELRAKRGDSTAADETIKSNDENPKFKTIPTKTISLGAKKENEQTRTTKSDNSDENTSPIRYQNILVVSQTPTSPMPNTSGTMKTPSNIPGEISENIDNFMMQTSCANPDISKAPEQLEEIPKAVMEEVIRKTPQSGKLMPKIASKTNDSVIPGIPETSSKISDMKIILEKAKNSSPLGLKKETAPMTSKSNLNTKTSPKSLHNSAICSPEKKASNPIVSIAKSSQTLADRNAARSFIMSYKIPKLKKPTKNGTQKNAAESPGSDKAHKMQNYLATLQNILNNDVVPQTWNVICANNANLCSMESRRNSENPSPQTSMENRFSNRGDLTIRKSRRKSMYADVADSGSILKPNHDVVSKVSDPGPLENQAEKPAKTIKSRRKSRVIEIFDGQNPETSNSSYSSISLICQTEEALKEKTKSSCQTNSIIKPKNPRRKSMCAAELCDSSSGKDEYQEIPTNSLATQYVEKTKEVVGTKERQGKEDIGIKSEKKSLVTRRKSMFAEGNESISSISESATNYEDTTGSQYDENPLQIIGNKSSEGSEGNGIESVKTSLIARQKSMFAEANESTSFISESTKYNDEATALESQRRNLDSTDNNLRSKKPLKLRRKSMVFEVNNSENSTSTSLDVHNEGIQNDGENEISMRLTEHNKTQNSVDKKPLKSRRKSMFVDREDLKSPPGQQLEKETNKSFVENMENMERGKSDNLENKPLSEDKAYPKSQTLKEKPLAVESTAQGQSTIETAVETKSEKKPLKARRRSLYTEILREEEESENLDSKQSGKSLIKTEGKDKEGPQNLANDKLKSKPLKSRRKSMYAEVGDLMAEERTCKPQNNELDDTTSQGKKYKPEAADILKSSDAKGKRRKSIYVEESITKEDAASNNLEIDAASSQATLDKPEAADILKTSEAKGKRRKSIYVEESITKEDIDSNNLKIDAASSQSTLDKPEAAEILKSSNAKGKRRKSMYVEEPITKEGIDSNNLKIDVASSQGTLDKPTAAEILKSSNAKGKRRKSMYVEEPIAKGDTDSNNLEKDKKKITKSRRKSMVVERHEVMDNNGPFTWDHNQGIEESLSEITTNAMDNTNFMPRDSQRLNVDMKDTQKMTAKTTKKRRKSMATFMGENLGENSKNTSYDVLLPNPSEAHEEITDRKSTLRPRSKSMYVETPTEAELSDKTAGDMPGDCINFNPKHFNSQRRILDSSSDEADTIVHTLPLKPVIQNVEIITPPPPAKKKCLARKRRVVKVLSSSYQADAMETPSSKDQQDFSATESYGIVTEKSCLSMLNTHPIFNTQVHDDEAEGNLNLNNMTPSLLHDDRFKEIDSTMQDMFNSPQHEPPIGEDQLLNETSSNLNVDETTNSNKENTTNFQDDTTSTTTTTMTMTSTTTTSTSISTHNTSDSTKHVTLGTSEYRFEKVSDNVVNLFISRKRKRKQK